MSAAAPCRSCSEASATWKTTNVTVIATSPIRRNTAKTVESRSGRTASRPVVMPTITFDCTVKKQNM